MAEKLTVEQAVARLPNKPFLTHAEVVYALGGVHPVTVYRYVQQGLLKSKRVQSRGCKSLYPRSGVEGFIRQRFSLS